MHNNYTVEVAHFFLNSTKAVIPPKRATSPAKPATRAMEVVEKVLVGATLDLVGAGIVGVPSVTTKVYWIPTC